jgi:hypothetical protein
MEKIWEDSMKLVRVAAVLVLTAAIGVVMTASTEAAELEKSSLKLAVGGKSLIAYLPLTIAERRGYFTKEGLDVEINDFQGGSKSLQALVGGSADIACGAYEHTLQCGDCETAGVILVAGDRGQQRFEDAKCDRRGDQQHIDHQPDGQPPGLVFEPERGECRHQFDRRTSRGIQAHHRSPPT